MSVVSADVMTEQPAVADLTRQSFRCPVKCATCNYEEKDYPAKFRELKIPQGEKINGLKNDFNHILFLLDGMLHVRLQKNTCHIHPGHCIFWARDTMPEVYAVEPSCVIVLGFSNRIVLGKFDWLARIATLDHPRTREIPLMKLDGMTVNVLENILPIESPCYHVLKQYDLFMSLANSCSEQELAHFFNPILRASDDFKSFVISNYTNGDSLDDMARKTNLSKSGFMRRFKEVFGVTAYQWLVKQKRRELIQMIANGQTHTKLMADTLGFNDQAGLYQFCRTQFGCSITTLMGHIGQNRAMADER